jgi:hypothetical protein
LDESVSPDGRIRFQVPRSAETNWDGNAFTARDREGTLVRGEVLGGSHAEVTGRVTGEVPGEARGGSVSLDSVFRVLFPDLEIQKGGLKFNEVKGNRYWESRAYVTVQGDRPAWHYLSMIRGNGKIFAVVVSTGGNLSEAVNQWLPAIQDNFEWQE